MRVYSLRLLAYKLFESIESQSLLVLNKAYLIKGCLIWKVRVNGRNHFPSFQSTFIFFQLVLWNLFLIRISLSISIALSTCTKNKSMKQYVWILKYLLLLRSFLFDYTFFLVKYCQFSKRCISLITVHSTCIEVINALFARNNTK